MYDNKREKLILIDGSSMLVTSFYGNLDKRYHMTGDTSLLLQTKNGIFTNAVYTMSKILLSILRKQKPTHMAIAWDLNRDDLNRKKIYKNYKSNREEKKVELSSQFTLMQQVLVAMNIPQFWSNGNEADDILGTLAKNMEKQLPVFIWTKDQDALQLITNQTRIWYPTKSNNDYNNNVPYNVKEFSVQTFSDEYDGLSPIQMIDKKALEGDKSDNIPGVKGIGPSSAVPLLKEYGDIETIYDVIENNNQDELKSFFKEYLGIKQSPINKLLANKEMAFLSKKLATIQTNLDEFDYVRPIDLQIYGRFNKEETLEIFDKLEFESLCEQLSTNEFIYY